jgi:TonB family protein
MLKMRLAPVVLIAASLAAGPLSATPTPQGDSKTDSSPPMIRVGGDIKPPVKIKNVEPVYPPIALRARIQGVVIIEATIGTDGTVKDTRVIRSIKLFDDAAVSAVRAWAFKPTVVNGQVVQVMTTISINFTLN